MVTQKIRYDVKNFHDVKNFVMTSKHVITSNKRQKYVMTSNNCHVAKKTHNSKSSP